MLKEQDRRRLDAIVLEMTQNNEPEENISLVVEDFKQKYSGVNPSQPTPKPPPAFMAKPGEFTAALQNIGTVPTEVERGQQTLSMPKQGATGIAGALKPLEMYSKMVPASIDAAAAVTQGQSPTQTFRETMQDPNAAKNFARPLSQPAKAIGGFIGENIGVMAAGQPPPATMLSELQPGEEWKPDYRAGANAGRKVGEAVGEFAGETVTEAVTDPLMLAGAGLKIGAKAVKSTQPLIKETIAALREATAKPFQGLSDRITASDVRFLKKDLTSGAKISTLKKHGIHGATDDAIETLDQKINELSESQRTILQNANRTETQVDLQKIVNDAIDKEFGDKAKLGREDISASAKEKLKASVLSTLQDRQGLVDIADAQQIKRAWGERASFASAGERMGIDPDAPALNRGFTSAYTALRDHIEKAVQQAAGDNPAVRRQLHDLNQDIHSLISARNAISYRVGVKNRQNALPMRNTVASIAGATAGGLPGMIAASAIDASLKSPITARALDKVAKFIRGKGVAEREAIIENLLAKKGITKQEADELRSYHRRSGTTKDLEGVQIDEPLAEREWGRTGQPKPATAEPVDVETGLKRPIEYPPVNNVADLKTELQDMKRPKPLYAWERSVNRNIDQITNWFNQNADLRGNIKNESLQDWINATEYQAQNTADKKLREALQEIAEKAKLRLTTQEIAPPPRAPEADIPVGSTYKFSDKQKAKEYLRATGQNYSDDAADAFYRENNGVIPPLPDKATRAPRPAKDPETFIEAAQQAGGIRWTPEVQNQMGLTFEDARKQFPGVFSREKGNTPHQLAERLTEDLRHLGRKEYNNESVLDALFDNPKIGETQIDDNLKRMQREQEAEAEAYYTQQEQTPEPTLGDDGILRGEDGQELFKETADDNSYEYRSQHTAPNKNNNYSEPITNITKHWDDDLYSKNGARYYGDGVPYDNISINILRAIKNKPNKKIKIYRAVDKDENINEINPGDWISINKAHAIEHGKSLNGKYKIISKNVYADEVYTDGNSIHEQGYVPRENDTQELSKDRLSSQGKTRSRTEYDPETKKDKQVVAVEFSKGANVNTAMHELTHARDMTKNIPEKTKQAFVKAMGLKEWNAAAQEKLAYGVEYLAREGELPETFPKVLRARMQEIAQREYGDGTELKQVMQPLQGKNSATYEGQRIFWEGLPQDAKDAIQNALGRGVSYKRIKTISEGMKKAAKVADKQRKKVLIARLISQANREYNENKAEKK